MSNKVLSVTLALVMALGMITIPAMAAGGKWGLEDITFKDSRGNQVTIPGGAKSCAVKVIEFTHGTPWTSETNAMNPNEILGAPDRKPNSNGEALTLGAGGVIVLEFDIYIYDGPGNDIYVFEVGPDVEATKVEVSSDLVNWIYVGDANGSISGVDMNGKVPADGRYKYVRITDLKTAPSGTWPGADIDAVAGINVTPYDFSGWAKAELEKADELNIIPEAFFGADLKKPITRAEFAAVLVKLYENLTGKKAMPASRNPFTDTKDVEVLKAYNIGLMAGTSADKSSPNELLNREQAVTMIVRVLKAAYIPGWTLATDNHFTLNFTPPAKFADNDKISEWAKPSVYFAAANDIIPGMNSNTFSPRATTAAEEAVNYASATRELALVTAVRMVDKLKDKPVDYSTGGVTTTQPPSGTDTQGLRR